MSNKQKGKCLTSWSKIWDYYYNELPKLESPYDRGKGPRWLFRGDNPCWLHSQGDDGRCPLRKAKPGDPCPLAEQGPGPLEPRDYGVLKDAFRSHLDRAFKEFEINDWKTRHEIEWGLMRTFRRKAHLHTGRRDDDWLERLGLMAHYEAPHRMLDWNYSFFNALYFAVNSSRHKGECIIWALDKVWLQKQADRLEKRIIKEIEATLDRKKASLMKGYRDRKSPQFEAKIIHFLMLTNRMPCIYPVTPYYQNERLSIQQGTFICAGTTKRTWGENLRAVLPKKQGQRPLVKIPVYLTTEERKKVLRELHSMNINQATLFPDLGGFAQSLRTRLADPETIRQKLPPTRCLDI